MYGVLAEELASYSLMYRSRAIILLVFAGLGITALLHGCCEGGHWFIGLGKGTIATAMSHCWINIAMLTQFLVGLIPNPY